MSNKNKEIKKIIAEQWLSSVPDLSAFTQNKFYKIVGCLVIGIELINLPKVENYRPYFVIYPLWKKDLKECLDSPVVLMEIYNKKGMQFSIPYLNHDVYFNEVIENIKRQVPILFSEDIYFKKMDDLICRLFDDILVKSNSAQQAKLFELRFYTALYVGNENQTINVLNNIKKASTFWNMRMFETWYGKLDLWIQGLQEAIIYREEFVIHVNTIKQERKMLKMHHSELLT
ncbi:hypothetical protein [Dyadobacter sp. 32]|uniref:hypothetical protein n=1 Tax=Dyadobacter sp. 32 TaxID=538966 RepID=UPI0011EF8713